MADLRRMDVGFQAGAILAVRAEAEAYDALVAALTDERADRWHTLDTDDSQILIDLSQVIYIRRERGDQRVGF
ncbi:hypothetical protein BH20ACT20_BH20ACT20_05180 [soil metagenome]|jgi:hypothetical protein